MQGSHLAALVIGSLVTLFISGFYQFLVFAGVIAYVATRPAVKKPSVVRSYPYGYAGQNEDVPHRNVQNLRELIAELDGCKTLPEVFNRAVENFGSSDCMGSRTLIKMTDKKVTYEKKGEKVTRVMKISTLTDYKYENYTQIGQQVAQFGSGLVKEGLKHGDKVCIFANTCKEWQVAAQACFAHGFPVVTVYATLGQDALQHALALTEVKCVITEAGLVGNLVKAMNSDITESLQTIVYIGDAKKLKGADRNAKGVACKSFGTLLKSSSAITPPVQPPQADDTAVIMFTSGTTGVPKGVVVSHKNIVSSCAAIRSISKNHKFTPDDVFIAYLPLAHILEMAAELTMMSVGATIGYASPKTLRSDTANNEAGEPCGDIACLRPTFMVAVPSILDKIRSGITSQINSQSPVVQYLFKLAYYFKKKNWLAGKESPIWNKIIFDKISGKFGGRLRFLISGGAPLSFDTQEFMNVVLGVPVMQGYGLTETCAGGTCAHPDDIHPGVVGAPIGCCEIKLVDCKELGYTAEDVVDGVACPRGEICIRGNNVTQGYYKMPEKTDEVFVEAKDGRGKWFYTGDIGMWHPNGNLQIIDRKKDLVKLADGEYVALGKLEAIFRNVQLVDNICIHADSFHKRPVAVVVPNEDALRAAVASQEGGIDSLPFDKLCKSSAAEQAISEALNAEAKKEKLARFEIPEAVALTEVAWTPENDFLTAAMKLKRRKVEQAFKKEIDKMLGK